MIASVKTVLDALGYQYQAIPHAVCFTAQETAEQLHQPGRAFAKVTMLEADGRPVMVVLPASRRVDLDRARGIIGAEFVDLLSERLFAELFPDCEVGAESPFGNLYGVPVYVDEELARQDQIAFNAGSHDEAIRMRFEDYQAIVNPNIAALAHPPRGRITAAASAP